MSVAKDAETMQQEEIKQFCTFRLQNRLFGVDILDVREVNTEHVFTTIYHSPEIVRGYVNIRGQLYLILDLRRVFGLDPREFDNESRLILFKDTVGETFGVLVDEVGDIIEVMTDDIEDRRVAHSEPPEGVERRAISDDVAIGVCKLENELLIMLNARRLLVQVERQLS